MQAQYRDRGVFFVGLTSDAAEELPAIREFIEKFEITWPNGYGAGETLERFGCQGYPSIWVIGPDGRIAWNDESAGALEDAIEQALQQTKS